MGSRQCAGDAVFKDEQALLFGTGQALRGAGGNRRTKRTRHRLPSRSSCSRRKSRSTSQSVSGSGISKAMDAPWRYGLRGSKFLSKPIKPA